MGQPQSRHRLKQSKTPGTPPHHHQPNQQKTMKTIQPNSTLTARSICDYDCIFKMQILARSKTTATINWHNKIRRAKIRIDQNGDEFIRPDSYSMAPIFRAI
jgi:hypothetical protein